MILNTPQVLCALAIAFFLIPSLDSSQSKNASTRSFSDFILKFTLRELGLIFPKTHSIRLIFI